jgi:histone deacetylase complex regulatory component SIN3
VYDLPACWTVCVFFGCDQVPVVLQRLSQKNLEWRKVRQDMKRHWRDICERNFNKSLDHRSFYFKQDDKKKMAPKGMHSFTHNKLYPPAA